VMLAHTFEITKHSFPSLVLDPEFAANISNLSLRENLDSRKCLRCIK
jgi:hypothetical protein